MLKYLCSFLKSLEQWEKYQPSSFWLCSIGLYISFSAGFGVLFPESPRQSHVVIEQVRGGGREDSGSSTSSAYIPPGRTTPRQTNPGTQDKTIKSSTKEYEPKWEEDNLIPPEERWKYDPDYWADYKYNREDFKKKFAVSQAHFRTRLVLKNYLIAVQENIFIRSTLKQLETSLTRCGKIQKLKKKLCQNLKKSKRVN